MSSDGDTQCVANNTTTEPDMTVDIPTPRQPGIPDLPVEPLYAWVASDGQRLADRLMTPTQAADFAVDHFEAIGYEVAVIGGKIGVRNTIIGGQYRWYTPVQPNRPALMWFREGRLSSWAGEGQLGDGDDVWFTCDQAANRLYSFVGTRSADIISANKIETIAETGHKVTWVGVNCHPDDVTLNDIEELRQQGPRQLTDQQWSALLELLSVQAESVGGARQEDAIDMLLVRMVEPLKEIR